MFQHHALVGRLLHLLTLEHFLPWTANMSLWETRQPIWDSIHDSTYTAVQTGQLDCDISDKKKKFSFHRSSAWLFAISLKYSASRYWHRAIPKYAVAGYCLQRRFRASAAFLGDSSFVTVKTYKEVKALWSQLGTKELLIASWAYKFAQEGKMYVYDGRTIFSEGIRACGCSVKSPHDINSFSLSHRSAQVYSGLHKISASIWKT